MIQSHLFGARILRVALVTPLAIAAVLGAATARAQGQPPGPVPATRLSESERARWIQERDQIRAEMIKLARSGSLDEAVALSVKELAVTREVWGELHEEVVGSLNGLAWFQEVREDWAAARKASMEVLDIRKRQPEQKDWRIADARRALADLDRRAALNPAQRQRLMEANRLIRLQDSLYKQRKYAEGIDPCRKGMEIWGELLGENHPRYAHSLNNLAMLYQAMGDYAKAEPLFLQALEISKRALGENHPDYATSLNNLALLYKAMGDYAKAGRSSVKPWRSASGRWARTTPTTPASLNNLALLYRAMGDHAKAEPFYRRALEIAKKALGENHPDYALGLNNLAMLYQDMGDYAKAEPLYRRALEIRKRVLGENHPDYAISLDNLACCTRTWGTPRRPSPFSAEPWLSPNGR